MSTSTSVDPIPPHLEHSTWRSIRPWTPPLSLSVREITSVSATFILSSSLSDLDNTTFTFSVDDDDEHDLRHNRLANQVENGGAEAARKSSIITDALAKGLSVNVNSTAWQRVFIRIDDKADEAVIIIYGLMPGRQYDVDLALVQQQQHGQNANLRRQVMTQDVEANGLPPTNDYSVTSHPSEIPYHHHHRATPPQTHDSTTFTPSTSPPSSFPSSISSSSSSDAPSLSSSSHSSSSSGGPIALTTGISSSPSSPSSSSSSTASSTDQSSSLTITQPQPTVEERLHQLRHTLELLNAERDSLGTMLKTARKDAQKADASLKAEIDGLRRASERNHVAEFRARQKVRALQEAVRRAQAGKAEVENTVAEVEKERRGLEEVCKEREEDLERVSVRGDQVKKEREVVEEEAKKRVEGMEAEMGVLTGRGEKLSGKKEKLETLVPELEERLRVVGLEIERAEREEEEEDLNIRILEQTFMPLQRSRHPSLTASPGAIARPTPIQRPSHVSAASADLPQQNNAPPLSPSAPFIVRPFMPPLTTKEAQLLLSSSSSSTATAPAITTNVANPSRHNSRGRSSLPNNPTKHHSHPTNTTTIQVPTLLTNPTRARKGSVKQPLASNAASTPTPTSTSTAAAGSRPLTLNMMSRTSSKSPPKSPISGTNGFGPLGFGAAAATTSGVTTAMTTMVGGGGGGGGGGGKSTSSSSSSPSSSGSSPKRRTAGVVIGGNGSGGNGGVVNGMMSLSSRALPFEPGKRERRHTGGGR